MALPTHNSEISFESSAAAVRYVESLLRMMYLFPAWIITIKPGKSGAFYVVTATSSLSADTQTVTLSKESQTILDKGRVGSSQ